MSLVSNDDIRDTKRAGSGFCACFKPLVNTWGSLTANAQGDPRQVLIS